MAVGFFGLIATNAMVLLSPSQTKPAGGFKPSLTKLSLYVNKKQHLYIYTYVNIDKKYYINQYKYIYMYYYVCVYVNRIL